MVPNTNTCHSAEHDDHTLRASLEDASLPPPCFTHRNHLRVAWSYLSEEDDFAIAAARFRATLKRYASAVGAAGKYHETITWAYLALVREAMEGRADRDADAMLAAHPDLLDHTGGALASVFDVRALTADPLARRLLVLPRRASLAHLPRPFGLSDSPSADAHIDRRTTGGVSARTSGS
jgi:hypothetical protein